MAESELVLADHAGKTCIVGIETGAANGGKWVCQIDNMSIGTKPQAGIAVDVLQGETKPTVGVEYAYSVSVANTGAEPQDSYVVNLMQNGKTEALASIEGESLASGDYETYVFEWVPSEAGEASLYAEVVSETVPETEPASSKRIKNVISGAISLKVTFQP